MIWDFEHGVFQFDFMNMQQYNSIDKITYNIRYNSETKNLEWCYPDDDEWSAYREYYRYRQIFNKAYQDYVAKIIEKEVLC